jgi:hypothetical protein
MLMIILSWGYEGGIVEKEKSVKAKFENVSFSVLCVGFSLVILPTYFTQLFAFSMGLPSYEEITRFEGKVASARASLAASLVAL